MVAMPVYAATATGTVAPKPVAMASMTFKSGGVLCPKYNISISIDTTYAPYTPIYAATATGAAAPKPVAMASITPRSGGVLCPKYISVVTRGSASLAPVNSAVFHSLT